MHNWEDLHLITLALHLTGLRPGNGVRWWRKIGKPPLRRPELGGELEHLGPHTLPGPLVLCMKDRCSYWSWPSSCAHSPTQVYYSNHSPSLLHHISFHSLPWFIQSLETLSASRTLLSCFSSHLTQWLLLLVSYAGSFSSPQPLHFGEPQDFVLRTFYSWVYTHSLGQLICKYYVLTTLQFKSPDWTVLEFCISNCLLSISICL